MQAVDTNVLVYAHRREVPEHETARGLLAGLTEGPDLWAVPWPCLFEFWSVVTNPRIWKSGASTPAQAWDQLLVWQKSPTLRLLSEPTDFFLLLEEIVKRPRVRGPVVHDARIAALCIVHGVDSLLTRDRDFSLFPELRTRNPFE